MTKKFIGFLLLIAIIFSVSLTGFSVLAETPADLVETDLVMDGDMEWLGTSYKIWTGTHAPEPAIVHGGAKSMKLSINAERPIYTQSGNGIVAGETYTMSYWIYAEESLEKTYMLNGSLQAAGAGVKIEIAGTMVDASGNASSATIASANEVYNPTEEELGRWIQRTISVTVPEDGYTKKGYTYYTSGKFTLHIRPQGTGTIWYDDITFTGKTTSSYAASLSDKKARYLEGYNIGQSFYDEYYNYATSSELAPGALNLFELNRNPGFENLDTTYTSQLSKGQSGRNENGEYYITKNGSLSEISGAYGWSRSNYLMNQASKFPNCTEEDYEVIYRDDTVYHSGEASMKIHVPSGYPSGLNKPYAMAIVTSGVNNCGESFVGGAEYVLSTWIKTENVPAGGGAFFKIQCNGTTTGEYTSSEESFTDGQWHQIKFVFEMPENTTSLYIYARLNGTGTVWYDDLVLGRSNSNDYVDFGSKHTFYYTDEPEIEAWTDFKTNIFDIESGSKVKFSLLDENENVVSSNEVATAEHNSWKFASSLLANKQTPYILKAEYTLANGTVLDSHSKRIYLYDRPTSMDANGNIHDIETGEAVSPFFMYGAKYATLDNMAEAGLEVVRINDMSLSLDDVQLKLDAAHERGMKVLVALYGTVAGHPIQIDTTRKVVSRFYTHPAVVAWMLMDEPNLQVTPLGIRTYEEMLYYLEVGYKAVRDIDPIHPVYNIETTGSTNDTYERTGQMCDIFAIDPYPASLDASIGGSLERATQRAINAVYNERPVWVLGLAADWSGSYGAPVTSSMLRYQLYDALWAGAKGSGHYLSDSPDYTNPTFSETYFDTFTKAKESGEIAEIFDHFSLGNSPVWAEGAGNGYQWRSWYKDNGDIYLAVRSKLGKDANNKDAVINTLTTDIKLVSSNGKVSIDGYDATLVNGISEEAITSSDNTVAITLKAGEVSLYKVTPAENVNLSYEGEGVPVALGEEMIENGDCETALPTGFSVGSIMGTLAEHSAEQSYDDGSYCIKITEQNDWDNTTNLYRNTSLSLDLGASYKLSFNMYTTELDSSAFPFVEMAFKNSKGHTITKETLTLYNSYKNNDTWTTYTPIFTVPADSTITSTTITFSFPKVATVYLDNISLKKVLAFSEHEMLTNTSFEYFTTNGSYTAANGTVPSGGWSTSSAGYSTFYIPAMSEVTPHSGSHTIGLGSNGTELIASNVPVEYGKTYEFSVWFNAKNLTDATTYPQLFVQTSGNAAYNKSLGHSTLRTDFTDAYTKKNDGWYKLTTTYTVPEYQEGYDITKATVAVKMMGGSPSVIGYVDDISFRVNPEKTGYTLRNLSYAASDTSITVEYDVTNHFTEDGGTVIYAFYDADGRFVKMEKETAAFDSLHVTKTFNKIDFASVKVFIWNAIGGLIPYSNMIE